MNHFNLVAKIIVCAYNELNETEKKLINAAKEAALRAYAPYSGFWVGAAVLLANAEIITGNNQENAAYPSGLCAERTTLFYANSRYPNEKVEAIAVAAHFKGQYIPEVITPCGSCRQVILEAEKRHGNSIKILLYGEKEVYIIESIRDLLPLSFDGSSLES